MSRGCYVHITQVPFERLADLARLCLPERGNPEFPPDRVERMFASRLEWLRGMGKRGLRVWMAYATAEIPVGFIECLPIEVAPRGVKGKDLTFITCLWVKPSSATGRGVASALLNAAEGDARLRSQGMAAVAYERSQHKPAEFFYRHGYSPASSRQGRVIVFKAFSGEARPPAWLEAKPGLGLAAGQDAGCPRVALFWSGQCPYFFSGAEDVRGWVAAAGRTVDYREIRTDDRAVAELHGVTGGIFVNGVQVDDGPPSRDYLWRLLDRTTGMRP